VFYVKYHQNNPVAIWTHIETKELLLYDDSSRPMDDDFVIGRVYKVRMDPDDAFDVAIGFSNTKIEIVEKHFYLSITQRWLREELYDLIDITESLFEQLVLLHKWNSLWLNK
jgi:hypothetical protein